MRTQFDREGDYFIQFHNGNIRIKNVKSSNEVVGHIIKDVVCFCYFQAVLRKVGTSNDELQEFVALGTSNGRMLVYSIAKNEVQLTIHDLTMKKIKCVCFDETNGLFSGSKNDIVHWDLDKNDISCRWKTGNQDITNILLIPNRKQIVSASNIIQLWDTDTKNVLKTFFTSSSTISVLDLITNHNGDLYFICGAKNERILSCWAFDDEKKPVAHLIVEDVVISTSYIQEDESSLKIAVVIQSGLLQVFQLNISSDYKKPVECVLIVQIVNEIMDNNDQQIIVSVPILNNFWLSETSLILAYGTDMFTHCEIMNLDYSKKVQYFIRDVKSINSQNATAAKTKKVPKILKNEVEFVQGNKRKQMADSAVSIEKRLENLLMKPTDPKELPCMNKLVQLLNQALRNGDHDMLKMLITSTTNQVTIRNTISNLSYDGVVLFLEQITPFFKSKPDLGTRAVNWCEMCLICHGSRLKTHSNIKSILSKVVGALMERTKYTDELREVNLLFNYAIKKDLGT